jgi:hypothetical protein
MMSSTIWSVSCFVPLPRRAQSTVWCRSVGSPCTIVVSYNWSTGPALHCGRLSVRLVSLDGAVYPHVL